MTRTRSHSTSLLGAAAAAAAGTLTIEAWSRRRRDKLDGNVPTFGLLLAAPGVAAARAAWGARNDGSENGDRGRWATQALAAGVTTAAAVAGTRTMAHLVAPVDLTSEPYHYRHFHYSFYDVERPSSVGRTLLDAKVTELDGSTINLTDLVQDRPLVIEFGSVSCPIYTEKVDRTNEVADRYAQQADFAVLYPREAHPGPKYDALESMDDKRARAADLSSVIGDQRRVVLDDLDGTVHHQYGAFPNSLLVVGRDGVISCWAEWTTAELMEHELQRVLANDGRGEGIDQTMITYNFARPGTLGGDVGAFLRPGVRSLADFVLALPRMGLGRVTAKLFPKAGGLRIV